MISARRVRSVRLRSLGVAVAVAAVVGLTGVAGAAAAPAWQMDSVTDTTVAPGQTLNYNVVTRNTGDVATDGGVTPIVLTIDLGPGLTFASGGGVPDSTNPDWSCAGTTVVTCTNTLDTFQPLDYSLLLISATVAPDASGVSTSSFALHGGDASDPATSTVDPTTITDTTPLFGVDAFDGQVADAAGGALTQAGGHPYAASTTIDFNTTTNPDPRLADLRPIQPVKDIFVDLPPGFVVNPTATARCKVSDLANSAAIQGLPLCSPASQVGTTMVRFNAFGGSPSFGPVPVYNLVSPPNVPAQFGFNVAGTVVTLSGGVRSGSDYGLSATVKNVSEGLALAGTTLTLWGVPADSSHDPERACPGSAMPFMHGPTCATDAEHGAFLRNPTACTQPNVGLTTGLHIDSWVNPGALNADGTPNLADPRWRSASFATHVPPSYPAVPGDWGHAQGPTGCDIVPFEPTISARPTAPAQAGQPAGLEVDIEAPQNDDPASVAEADLKRAVVTLPAGVRISPAAADGLQACTSAQIALHSTADPACPEASKIGSLTIKTPLLDQPLTGSVYLATPNANPFGSLVALYLVARGPGVVLKIAGEVKADPVSGQLTTTFDDNPQLPFSDLHLEFKSGPRAPLVLPLECKTYTTHATFTSWSGSTVDTSSDFALSQDGNGAPCPPRDFAPGFTAGSENPVAGSDSAFVLGLTRSDLDRDLGGLSVDMPTGLLGRVAGTVLCSDVDASAGTCGDGSKIGDVTVGAGAGSDPFYINNGRAYITGPYKGAPFGLSIVVPAVAGPFDLGDVVVRATVNVDRSTAQLHVVSDPLPTILQGIPLDVRDVRVAVNRSHFVVNPTSCAEKHVLATVTSTEGARADVSSRFQVGDCAALPLAPKLAIALTGKGQTTDDKHPAVVASLTQPAGQANLKKVTVSLPLSLALDPDNANGLCEFADGSKDDPTCPKASIVGSATARTPILNQPLTGPVYFVKNIRKDPKSGREIRTLPKLVIPLTGENGVRLNVTGTSSVVGGRLVTTFDNLPDAPVSSFTLNIAGGKHGILVVSGTDICKATQVADQQIDGQNGKTADTAITLATPACGLKLLSKKIGKRSVTLKVSGLGAGKVTVTGKGIKKTSRTIKAATVATITARRTGHSRPSGVKVSFTPQGSHKAIATTVRLRTGPR